MKQRHIFWLGYWLMLVGACKSMDHSSSEALPPSAFQTQSALGNISSSQKILAENLTLHTLELKILKLGKNTYPYIVIAQPPKSDFFQAKICTDTVCQDPRETTQSFIFLPGLQPGAYTFQVRACVQALHAIDSANPCGAWVTEGPYTQTPVLDPDLDKLLVQQDQSLQQLSLYGNSMYQLLKQYEDAVSTCAVSADQRPSSLDEVDIHNALALGPDAFSFLMYPLNQIASYAQADTSVPFSLSDYNALSYQQKKMADQIFQANKYHFTPDNRLVDAQGARLDYYEILQEISTALDATYITYRVYLALDAKEKKALSLIIGEKKYRFDDEVLVDDKGVPVDRASTLSDVKDRAQTISDDAVSPPAASKATVSLPALLGSIAGFFLGAWVLKSGWNTWQQGRTTTEGAVQKKLDAEALKQIEAGKPLKMATSEVLIRDEQINNAKSTEARGNRRVIQGKVLFGVGVALVLATVITSVLAGTGNLNLAADANSGVCPNLDTMPTQLKKLQSDIQQEMTKMDALGKTISSHLP